MMNIGLWIPVTFVIAIAGCAGIAITPIKGTPGEVRDAMIKGKKDGYVVYHPMITFEVVDKEVCKDRNANGICTNSIVVCGLGTRYVLPDYQQAYVVQITSGIGKAGADISFTDGWLLSNVKDNSDNTALLEVLFKAALGGYKTSGVGTSPDNEIGCKDRGLYRYKLEANRPSICRFWGAGNSTLDCK